MPGKATGGARRRHPIKYAAVAGVIAVISVVLIEATGSMLTSNYSGLGGKLSTPPQTAPASAPVR
jgi:hypothetical protein